MLDETFDRMIKKCSTFASRRTALGILALATLGNSGLMALSDETTRAKKKHKHKPNPRRVTRTFANPSVITIPAGGAATPYPAAIQVSGFQKAHITDVKLTLRGLSHTRPSDIDVMLVAPNGRNAIVMADIGNGTPVVDLTITLDDQANPPPDLGVNVPLPSGTYRPTNNLFGEDPFDGAPAPSGAVALSTFSGSNPNGAWQLYVFDDQGGSDGAIAGGWELSITAQIARKRKKGGKGKGKGK
jgi:subtilisin-like proprotein convertase family protein